MKIGDSVKVYVDCGRHGCSCSPTEETSTVSLRKNNQFYAKDSEGSYHWVGKAKKRRKKK